METDWITASVTLPGGELYQVGVPQPEHVEQLAFTIRPADLREVERFAGPDAFQSIKDAVALSTVSRVALVDGTVLAITGVCIPGMFGGYGYPWCLTAMAVDNHRKLFLRSSKFYLARFCALCPAGLEVYVDAEHTKALRWLRWMGFEIGPGRLINDHPFRRAVLSEVA